MIRFFIILGIVVAIVVTVIRLSDTMPFPLLSSPARLGGDEGEPLYGNSAVIEGVPADSEQPTDTPSSVSLDTTITSGPSEGATLTHTTITFSFNARVTGRSARTLTFDTKLDGFDDDWVAVSVSQRTITVPTKRQLYTFQVRARTDDMVDDTPATRSFTIAP